jgi:chromosomal replication initiation ATPase DnaA
MGRRSAAARDETAAVIDRTLAARAPRPLALVGRSGCGKTTLLRAALEAAGAEPLWTTARALADTIVDAIRRGAHDEVLATLVDEPRPLVIEHLEDVRGMPRTLEELRLLLEARRRRGLPVFLTLTTRPGAGDIARWLVRHAEVAKPALRPPRLH